MWAEECFGSRVPSSIHRKDYFFHIHNEMKRQLNRPLSVTVMVEEEARPVTGLPLTDLIAYRTSRQWDCGDISCMTSPRALVACYNRLI
jgi:hypothetical protein